MTDAIQSSATCASCGTSSASEQPSGALQAQLDRCEKQLADQVNCSSAKTLEGKANIQKLSGQISALKQQIEDAKNSNVTANRPTRQSTPAVAAINNSSATARGTRAIGQFDLGMGGRVSVLA
jgi:FlxA-like protein